MLISTFSVYHPRPVTLNENASIEITDLFIKEISERGIYLIESDYQLLQLNKNLLFEQIQNNNDEYLQNAIKTYKKALERSDSILGYLSTKKLSYADNDTIAFLNTTNVFYSPSIKYHTKRVERYIKSRAYDWVINTDGYEKLTEAEFNNKALEFSKTIILNFKKNIKEQMDKATQYIESNLLNALALRLDPHSNYFTEEQNRNFSKQLSAQVETYGVYFDENDEGAIYISYIEPGSSGWMSNEINEGDIFISYKMGNQIVTNENTTAYEIQEKLDNSADKKISLTLKKQNGLIKTVKLVKQKMASDENNVKGYVLSNNKLNIGYISLPSFYTDMDGSNKPGCANDVAKEILKLESDTIQGLIIDLRNNGGGSMQEAMDLAGIFIDEGPLFIYKEKNKKPLLIKDINRGSIFKKPLVVMINELSASASELFSNIVKDYNIGLVVGQSSYGKGSAQSIIPLDTNILRYKSLAANNKDFIKITNAKFYRLNCSTHQGIGVTPDIILPSSPASKLYKENKEQFFLESDSITKKVIFNALTPLPLQSLQDKSKQRVEKSGEFTRYKLTRDSIDKFITAAYKVPLKFTPYKKKKEETDKLYLSFENSVKMTKNTLSCKNNTFDLKLTELNVTTKEFNSKIIESISSDIFVNETFNIITDIINK